MNNTYSVLLNKAKLTIVLKRAIFDTTVIYNYCNIALNKKHYCYYIHWLVSVQYTKTSISARNKPGA